MVINRTAFWVLVVFCCVPSTARFVQMRLDEAKRLVGGRLRRAPLAAVGACIDGLMTGVGVGLSVACGTLLMAAIWVRAF